MLSISNSRGSDHEEGVKIMNNLNAGARSQEDAENDLAVVVDKLRLVNESNNLSIINSFSGSVIEPKLENIQPSLVTPPLSIPGQCSKVSHRDGSRGHYQVVVRLKPKLKRAPGIYVMHEIVSLEAVPAQKRVALHTLSSSNLSFASALNASLCVDGLAHDCRCPSASKDKVAITVSPTVQALQAREINDTSSDVMLSITKPTMDTDGSAQCTYRFSDVVGPDVPDTGMCAKLVPSILAQLNGRYNVCVLCHGQIGTGKTHTTDVLSQALISAVFELISTTDIVELSYIQICGNKAYNLLASSCEKNFLGMPLPSPRDGVAFEPRYLVKSVLEADSKRRAGQKYRYTIPHASNAGSSRSHTLLSLYVTKYRDGVALSRSQVTVVDLAGSERVAEIGVAGEGFNGASDIDKSLAMLESYIVLGDDTHLLDACRDTVLMAYLLPRLRHWHVLLIVTVSLENKFEMIQKCLEFATAGKDRVLEKRSYRLTDYPSFTPSYEESLLEFIKSINLLYAKAYGQREDSGLGWIPSDCREKLPCLQLSKSIQLTSEPLPDVLSGRYKELQEVNKGEQPPWRARCNRLEVEESSLEHNPVSPSDQQNHSATIKEILNRFRDQVLWLSVQLDDLREQRDVLEKVVEDLRGRNGEVMAEVEKCRREIGQSDDRVATLVKEEEALIEEHAMLKDEIEQLHMKCFLNYVDRAVRCEMLDIFKCASETSGDDSGEFGKVDLKAAEYVNTADQAYLSIQSELEASEKKYEKLRKEWDICAALNKLLWNSCTAQQKMQISCAKNLQSVSPNTSEPTSWAVLSKFGGFQPDEIVGGAEEHSVVDHGSELSCGMESIKLRSIVEDLKGTLEDTMYERSKATEQCQRLTRENEKLRQELKDEAEKNICYAKELQQVMRSVRALQQQVENSNAYFTGQRNKYAELAAALDRSDEENKRLSSENEKLKSDIASLKRRNETVFRSSTDHDTFQMYNMFSTLQKHFTTPSTKSSPHRNHAITGAVLSPASPVLAPTAPRPTPLSRNTSKITVSGRRLTSTAKSESLQHGLCVRRSRARLRNCEGSAQKWVSLQCNSRSKPALPQS